MKGKGTVPTFVISKSEDIGNHKKKRRERINKEVSLVAPNDRIRMDVKSSIASGLRIPHRPSQSQVEIIEEGSMSPPAHVSRMSRVNLDAIAVS